MASGYCGRPADAPRRLGCAAGATLRKRYKFIHAYEVHTYLEASLVGVLLHSTLVPAGLVHLQRLLAQLSPLVGALDGSLLFSLPQPLSPVIVVDCPRCRQGTRQTEFEIRSRRPSKALWHVLPRREDLTM